MPMNLPDCVKIAGIMFSLVIAGQAYSDPTPQSPPPNRVWKSGATTVTYSSHDSTLRISGNGAMEDYEQYYLEGEGWQDDCPWRNDSLLRGVQLEEDLYNWVLKDGRLSNKRVWIYKLRMEVLPITNVIIEDGVTRIGNRAFVSSSLASVTIPNSVTRIGKNAFEYCKNLTSLTIPNSVLEIERGAFNGCTSLTYVTIPNSVTEIGDGAFMDCSSLTSVTIPSSVTKIGMRAFMSCSSLTSVTIPNGVKFIGVSAFFHCVSLTSVTIPSSVTKIGNAAFEDCESLIMVTVQNPIPPIFVWEEKELEQTPRTAFKGKTSTKTMAREIPWVEGHGQACGAFKGTNYGRYATLFVPANSIDAYRYRNIGLDDDEYRSIDGWGWTEFKRVLAIPEAANSDPWGVVLYSILAIMILSATGFVIIQKSRKSSFKLND